jgi:hypothetical protein
MKKPSAKNSAHLPAQPIELVCVSPHKHAGPLAKEPDKLTTIRGKWAWCPSGAQAGHDWKPVASGSFNDLRVQLAEVSRLVDVALNTGRPATKALPVAKRSNASGRTKPRKR